MSDSRIQFPAMVSGASLAGTCLMQTIMFTGAFLFGAIFAQPTVRGRAGIEILRFAQDDTRGAAYATGRTPVSLAGPALENERGVGAAKPKGVGKRVFQRGLAGFVRNVVQIASRVRRLLVDRGRQNLVAQRQDADARFESTRTAEQMPGHRFCGADRHLLGAFA